MNTLDELNTTEKRMLVILYRSVHAYPKDYSEGKVRDNICFLYRRVREDDISDAMSNEMRRALTWWNDLPEDERLALTDACEEALGLKAAA